MNFVCILVLIGFKGCLSQRPPWYGYDNPLDFDNLLAQRRIKSKYDFIIVGGGTAGSVIANRLSEVPDWDILLLEKGPEGNVLGDIPFINPLTILGPNCVQYEGEIEQNVCEGLNGKRCPWATGHGVGGATLINGMLYSRGDPSTYDNWDLEDWSFNDVLPYFLKSENMSVNTLAASDYHSTQGPLHIDYPYITKLGQLFIQAGQEMGYDIIDYNNPKTTTGFGISQITTKNGRRFSASSAFLEPVKNRPNLHVIRNMRVSKIIIDKTTKKATGVEFMQSNSLRNVLAKKEVIISAGAIGSPQLLMLSGIGPSQDLQNLNIPIIADLPVGKNLQTHLGTPATIFLINTNDSYTSCKLLRTSQGDFIQWYNGRKTIYSNNGGEALAFLKSNSSNGVADIELVLSATSIAADSGDMIRRAYTITDEEYYGTWGSIGCAEAFTIGLTALFPKSRGEVKLVNRNINDPLLIRGNLLSDPTDRQVMIEAIRAAIQVAGTKAFQQVGATLFSNPVLGCESFEFNTDEYWDCALRRVPINFSDQCGTCRMGTDLTTSVVDRRLKVHGVSQLRVADASVIPSITGAHTMAPCYMIGEKAADMIKQDWNI